MQKLLATSAIAMIALSGAAFAQDSTDADFTLVDDNSNVASTPSLLSTILDDAQTIQVNMINAAENLANLDGSINILDSDSVNTLLQEITASVGFGDGDQIYTWELPTGDSVNGENVFTGTQAEYEAFVNGYQNTYTNNGGTAGDTTDDTTVDYAGYLQALADGTSSSNFTTNTGAGTETIDLVDVRADEDVFAGILKGVSQTVDGTTAIDFFDPALTVDALQTDITNLTTTVIGALNTGVIGQNGDTGIAANTLAMANMQLESVAQTTGSLANSAQYFEPGNLQLANIATNMATVVDASVNVDQLMANVDNVATTLIGALNTGDIATDVNQNASNLTQALVGQ
jgi:hypothetical protein